MTRISKMTFDPSQRQFLGVKQGTLTLPHPVKSVHDVCWLW